MSASMSRLLSAATMTYAVYALAKPRHLGAVLTDDAREQQRYDLVATTYGWRDLTVGAVGLLAPAGPAVRAAMLTRVALDLSDAAVLAPRAQSTQARTKVLAATLGWATLNAVAVLVDARRD